MRHAGVVAVADEADEVGLHARLGEREVRRAHAGAGALAEHHADEVVDGAAQVRHGQALVDREGLDLVEDGGMRGVEVVGAEDLAGRDDVDRRGALEHGADLHRRGLGAQDETAVGRVDEEGVLHLAGRVVLAEVEGVEVQPLGLDLRALDDLPAGADEGVHEPLGRQLERVPGAGRAAADGAGDVDRLLDEDAPVALVLELALPGGVGPAELGLGRADPLAGLGLGARRQGADLALGRGDGAAVDVGERAALRASRLAAAAKASRAARDGRVEGRGVEGGDLDGVVLRVGSGHRFVSLRGGHGASAQWRGSSGSEPVGPGLALGGGSERACSGAPEGNVNRKSAPPGGRGRP